MILYVFLLIVASVWGASSSPRRPAALADTTAKRTPSAKDYNCDWNSHEPMLRHLEITPERIRGREVLLDIIRNSGLDYTLESGTLLGSFRHRGFIDNDGDSDVIIFAEKKASTWNLPSWGLNDMPYDKIREFLVNHLKRTAEKLYPNHVIEIYIGAYSDQKSILGRDDIDWNTPGYLCTLTLSPIKNKVRLTYPNVLDVDLLDARQFSSRWGNKCICYLYEKPYNCFTGAKNWLSQRYGSDFMIEKTWVLNSKGKRIYSPMADTQPLTPEQIKKRTKLLRDGLSYQTLAPEQIKKRTKLLRNELSYQTKTANQTKTDSQIRFAKYGQNECEPMNLLSVCIIITFGFLIGTTYHIYCRKITAQRKPGPHY